MQNENKVRIIRVAEIKPKGSLKYILERFENQISVIEKEGYSPRVPKLISLIVNFGFCDIEYWIEEAEKNPENSEEIESIVLFSQILIIRLNNIGEKYHNNIENLPSLAEQFSTNPEIRKYFKDLTFE